MSNRNPSARVTTNVIAASGRLRNDHFLLTADRILLEVDQASFELVSATAEGNIQVHMATPDPEGEYVIFAESAVYQPQRQCLNLNGWVGTRENGMELPANVTHHEIMVPTDGSFHLPYMQDQAEKRLPISTVLKKAA